MTTFDTKAAQIQAIREGDLIAIRDWMDERPQNEYAVEKLIVSVLLDKLVEQEKHAPLSKEDLISKLLVTESALRVIRAMLDEPIGQAMVVAPRTKRLPRGTATAYDDDAIDMMCGISDISLTITGEDAKKFLVNLQAEEEKAKRKRRKPPTRRLPPSSY
jgi:hypothetical protein